MTCTIFSRERRPGLVLALGLGLASCSGDATGEGGSPPDGPAPLLPDVAAEAGIDFRHVHGGSGKKYLFETMGSGVAATDLDGDSLPDLLFVQSGTLPAGEFDPAQRSTAGHTTGDTHRLYLNRGELQFEDATAGSGLEDPVYAMGVTCGDVDSDGDRDLFVACYGADRLHLNDGRAHFTDATATSGVGDPRWTIAGVFFDADLDGDLDLYSVGYLDMPLDSHRYCGPSREIRTYCHVDTWPGLDDRLALNDGTGVFTDGSADASLAGTRGKGLAAVAGDYDDDGDADLFVANDSSPNLMLRNEGGGRFTDVGARSGADLNGEGRTEACMGVDMGDLDGDGDLDMYVVNFEQETNTLYRNDGGGFFTDVSVLSGAGAHSLRALGFGTAFLDLENDGDLDIWVANGHIMDNVAEYEPATTYAQPDHLYLNDGRGRFSPAPGELSPALSEPRVGRGVARADLDRDGDDDLVVTNSDQAPWILRNDLASGHRIVLRLHGPGGRADAENARVTAELGERLVTRELVAGGTYLSHHGAELVLGLGDATVVDRLLIRWPGGPTSEHTDLAADRRYVFAHGGELLKDEPLPEPGGAP
jgi:hypothetical protein